MKRITQTITCALVFGILSIASASAQDPCKSANLGGSRDVLFDHLNDNQNRSYVRKLKHREEFKIYICNTAPDQFTYDVAGVVLSEPKTPGKAAFTASQLKTKELPQVHDKKYGGYIVHIRRKPDLAPITVNGTELRDVTLMIFVETLSWDYEIAGAFTLSTLTDSVFAVDENQALVQDTTAEDDFNLGVAAFVHVFNKKLPQVALTFGLGVDQRNQATYYVGPSWRLGETAAITVGAAIGSVDRLPAGMSLGSQVTDPNLLANLDSRIDTKWFFALSYTFLNPGDRLEKPFKGAK